MSMSGSSLIRLPDGNAVRSDLIAAVSAWPRRKDCDGTTLSAFVAVNLDTAPEQVVKVEMPNFRAARQARDLLLDTLGVPPTGGPADDMAEEDED